MPLIAPTIKSEVSECSKHILTEGNLTGSTVKVYQNSANLIGQGVANSSQHWVAINGGVVLQQGDTITATQTLGPDTSPQTPEPKEVQGAPANPPAPIFKTHLYGCASCLWLGGMKTGKILFFGGDQHTGSLNDNNDIDHTRLMDAETFRIKTITGLVNPPSDVFCAGHAQTAAGDLLVAGGTYDWRLVGEHIDHAAPGHFIGSRDTWIFDAAGESWVRKGLLHHERVDDFVSEHLASWLAEPDNQNATPWKSTTPPTDSGRWWATRMRTWCREPLEGVTSIHD